MTAPEGNIVSFIFPRRSPGVGVLLNGKKFKKKSYNTRVSPQKLIFQGETILKQEEIYLNCFSTSSYCLLSLFLTFFTTRTNAEKLQNNSDRILV